MWGRRAGLVRQPSLREAECFSQSCTARVWESWHSYLAPQTLIPVVFDLATLTHNIWCLPETNLLSSFSINFSYRYKKLNIKTTTQYSSRLRILNLSKHQKYFWKLQNPELKTDQWNQNPSGAVPGDPHFFKSHRWFWYTTRAENFFMYD